MNRSTRLAILGGSLLILVAGTALGTQALRPSKQDGPTASQEQPQAPPSADELAQAQDRLAAHGIDATVKQLSALAADYGLGGAIRLLAWVDAPGMSVGDLRGLRDDGAGWGQLAHDLGVSPGIGSIMGNGGHGREDAPGQLKPKPAPDATDESGAE
jgi:hypothetical protein